MSRRTKPTNAYQALTTGLVSTGADIIPLDVIGDLDFPAFIILSPFSATLREVIKYTAINASTVTTLTRGLAGSVGGVAHEHPSGSIAISAPTEQLIDDIFSDIEDLEAGTSTWAPADAAHAGAADPHTGYVQAGGDTMTGELVVPGAAPTADAVAANKKYVDDKALGFAGDIIMTGRATAPSGWLLCDGAAISRSTFADLFAAISTAYGVGDGSTTFNVPDLRQRFPLGKAASGTGSVLGATGGVIDHTHQAPLHAHVAPDHYHTYVGPGNEIVGSGTGATVTDAPLQVTTGTPPSTKEYEGSNGETTYDGDTDTDTENPPFQTVNYLIRT